MATTHQVIGKYTDISIEALLTPYVVANSVTSTMDSSSVVDGYLLAGKECPSPFIRRNECSAWTDYAARYEHGGHTG